MRLTIEDDELTAEAARLRGIGEQAKAGVVNTLMAGAMTLVARVKEEMPFKSGRAAGSWGSPLAGGVWEVDEDGLSVLQGTNVDYVGRLNEGYSQQAPAGFIDVAVEDTGDTLGEAIQNLLDRML